MTVMWSVLSALLILALWGMQALLNSRNVTFSVWQWAAYVAWLLWTLAGIALVWTFTDEREARPIGVTLLLFGLPAVIVAVVLALLWILP